MAARPIRSIVPLLVVVFCLIHGAVSTQGSETGRRLLRASPSPPSTDSSPSPNSPAPSKKTSPSGKKESASPRGGYNGDSGLGGITPAKVPGAKYPADVVTCGICQSAVPGRNSTAASDGVNKLYRRGGSANTTKSPVAGTIAATLSCVVLTPGPSGQNGAPGLAATVQAAIQRGDSSVKPFAVAYGYAYSSGSSQLKGYLKQALDAIHSADGCTPVIRLISSAWSDASSDGTGTDFARGFSQSYASDDAITGCWKGYGTLSSGQTAANAFKAAGAASS